MDTQWSCSTDLFDVRISGNPPYRSRSPCDHVMSGIGVADEACSGCVLRLVGDELRVRFSGDSERVLTAGWTLTGLNFRFPLRVVIGCHSARVTTFLGFSVTN